MSDNMFEQFEELYSRWPVLDKVAKEMQFAQDRYHGKAMVTVDYDALNSHVKDWGQIKKNLTTIDD